MRPRNRLKAVGNSLEGESGGFSISLEASLQRRKRKALISEDRGSVRSLFPLHPSAFLSAMVRCFPDSASPFLARPTRALNLWHPDTCCTRPCSSALPHPSTRCASAHRHVHHRLLRLQALIVRTFPPQRRHWQNSKQRPATRPHFMLTHQTTSLHTCAQSKPRLRADRDTA